MYTSQFDLPSRSLYHSLSQLALTIPPHLRPDDFYQNLNSSTHWIDRFKRIQTLGESDTEDGFGNNGHRVVQQAYGSTGCVNALDFEQGGQERLASAGDDTKICIWKPGLDRLPSDDDAEGSPDLGYGLSEVIDTGHRANIFGVKWAPHNENRLFSCAGDCTVRVYDISLSTNPKLSTVPISVPPHRSWQHHSDSSACTQIIRCHTDRVKRISTDSAGSDSTFLTCSEDGTVRQHDLRTTHQCRVSSSSSNRFGGGRGGRGGENCPEPLVDYSNDRISLYSLSTSRLRPYLFVVGGTSPFAYLHDRRMIRKPIIEDWSIEPDPKKLTECVRRFGVPKEERGNGDGVRGGGGGGFIDSHIVATKLSPTNSRDLIVSYSERGIYRFDILGDTYVEPLVGGEEEKEEEEGEMEVEGKVEEEEEGEEKGEKTTTTRLMTDAERVTRNRSELLRVIKRTRETTTDEEEVEAVEGGQTGREEGIVEGGAGEVEERDEDEMMSEVDVIEDDDDGDDEDAHNRGSDSNEELTIPLIAPSMHYTGHANSQTVKDVNFAFEGQTIVSGSDDGNFFVWRKDDGECLGIFKGDSSVVNVIIPHPRLPLLAISGIDSTVKVFGPSMDLEGVRRSNLVGDFETIKGRNERGEGRRLGSSYVLPDALLRLLALRTGVLAGGDDEDAGEGDEDAERAGRGVRVYFEDPSAPGGRRAADCIIA